MTLHLLHIPYTFVKVPSMMPRTTLTDLFALTYRKIPVLAVGRDVYADTSLIAEALESHPALAVYRRANAVRERTLYPPATLGGSPWEYRQLARAFASYWIDRPFFRVTCGLMPAAIWRTSFGTDRAGLIGHVLDPDKLEKKVPENLGRMEMQLGLLEPLFATAGGKGQFLFRTRVPSLADVALFYQLKWGREVSRGELVADLTAGGNDDLTGSGLEGMDTVFTQARFPNLWAWFERMMDTIAGIDDIGDERCAMERAVELGDTKGVEEVTRRLKEAELPREIPIALNSVNPWNQELDARVGIALGKRVRIAPDDTGMNDPVFGRLVAASAEEVVVVTDEIEGNKRAVGECRMHFPRVGFVVRNADGGAGREAKL